MELFNPSRERLQTDADVRYIHVVSKAVQRHDEDSMIIRDVKILRNVVRDSLSNPFRSLDQVYHLLRSIERDPQMQITYKQTIVAVLKEPEMNAPNIPTPVLLHCAVLIGDVNLVKMYASNGSWTQYPTLEYTFDMIGERDTRRLCPLQVMAMMGHTDLMKATSNEILSSDFYSATTSDKDKPADLNPLILSTRFGRESFAKEYLEMNRHWNGKQINVNEPTTNGYTALHIAAIYNHESLLDWLLQKGAAVNSMTSGSIKYPIAFAAALGHKNIVENLLKYVDCEFDRAALIEAVYVAAAMGKDEVLELLLKLKLNYSLKDRAENEEHSPYTVALLFNNIETAHFIQTTVSHTEVVETPVDSPDTATIRHAEVSPQRPLNGDDEVEDYRRSLHETVMMTEEMVTQTQLSSLSDNVQSSERDNGSSMHLRRVQPVGNKQSSSAPRQRVDELLEMKRNGLSLEKVVTKKGLMDILKDCVMKQDTGAICALYDLTPSYNVDESQNSFLHLAAEENKGIVLEKFISGTWSWLPQKINCDGEIPLITAIIHGQSEAVEILLTASPLSYKNFRSQTALHIAVLNHKDGRIIKLIADEMNNQMLLEQMDGGDEYHLTALHYAIMQCPQRARECECDCIQQLSLLNPGPVGTKQISALHLAAKLGDSKTLHAVLRVFDYKTKKLEINALNGEDRTALMICAENGDVNGFKLLLNYGADIKISNSNNENVVHLMVRKTVSAPDKVEPILKIFKLVTNHFREVNFVDNAIEIEYDANSHRKLPLNLSEILTKCFSKENGSGEHLNALQLAAYLGASKMFGAIVEQTNSVRNVGANSEMEIGVEKQQVNSETVSKDKVWKLDFIIPWSLNKSAAPDVESKLESNKSCIELITFNRNASSKFVDMMEVEPIKSLVNKLSRGRLICGTIIIILHIIYMSCFSVYAIRTCSNYTSIAWKDSEYEPTPYLYCLFLVYPLVNLGFLLFQFKIFCTSQYLKLCNLSIFYSCEHFAYLENHFIFVVLSASVSVLFITLVVVWYVQYLLYTLQQSVEFVTYARTTSLTLLVGWLYTIDLMRGIPIFQAFAKYLKLIFVKDVLRIICVYAVLLTAFGLAIHVCILVQSSDAESVVDTLFQTFGAMFGTADIYGANANNRQMNRLNSGLLSEYFRGLLAIYVLMSTIILLNVLIAMINQSYNSVYDKSTILWDFDTCKTFIDLSHGKGLTQTPGQWILKHYIYSTGSPVFSQVNETPPTPVSNQNNNMNGSNAKVNDNGIPLV